VTTKDVTTSPQKAQTNPQKAQERNGGRGRLKERRQRAPHLPHSLSVLCLLCFLCLLWLQRRQVVVAVCAFDDRLALRVVAGGGHRFEASLVDGLTATRADTIASFLDSQ